MSMPGLGLTLAKWRRQHRRFASRYVAMSYAFMTFLKYFSGIGRRHYRLYGGLEHVSAPAEHTNRYLTTEAHRNVVYRADVVMT